MKAFQERQAFKNLCSALEITDADGFDNATVMNMAATRLHRFKEELSDSQVAPIVKRLRENTEEQLVKKGVIVPPDNWVFERSSGYAGYRCTKCATWVYMGQPLRCSCNKYKRMSKKEFLKTASLHIYGKGINRKLAIFWDWKQDIKNGILGYSHMILSGEGCPKKDFMNYAYDVLVLGKPMKSLTDNGFGVIHKVALTEQGRFKVPLSM